jgi:hypothetical protein
MHEDFEVGTPRARRMGSVTPNLSRCDRASPGTLPAVSMAVFG